MELGAGASVSDSGWGHSSVATRTDVATPSRRDGQRARWHGIRSSVPSKALMVVLLRSSLRIALPVVGSPVNWLFWCWVLFAGRAVPVSGHGASSGGAVGGC